MIVCPICTMPMVVSGNQNLYFCEERSVWVSELEASVLTRHALIYVNPNTDKHEVISIEIHPYQIVMWDQEELQRTEITEIIWEENSRGSLSSGKKVLSIDAVLDLPWDDQEEVVRRIKMYLVFS